MKGYLTINTLTAETFMPVPMAHIMIMETSGKVLYDITSDRNGNTSTYELEAPDVELTLDKDYLKPAYANYNVMAEAPGYYTVNVKNVEIVATAKAILDIQFHPLPSNNSSDLEVLPAFNYIDQSNDVEDITIPPVGLLIPTENRQTTAPYFSIRDVFIPDYITVHLGTPQNTSAENVRVSFVEYIANVASSEIYPTWPFNSLVANIHVITTFALNRVYTEWYRSRGFNFDITNSTQYDQYFVKGRNIFENIKEIARDVFNTYARRFGFRNPFFTQYCNGTTSTCPGLSQWGTVDLANRGYSPIQILRYYYPNDLELITTDEIRGIQETFPGFSLRLGSSGAPVLKMQHYLNRIRANFPLIPQIPNPQGFFDDATRNAVIAFQRTFNLTQDGIIGRNTWNAISFKYVGVIRLAELDSEGERVGIGMNPPNVVIRQGSRGIYVTELQFILNTIASFYESIPYVIQDSVFDAETLNAVIQFQNTFGLTPDGIVGPATWNMLYSVYRGIKDNSVVPPSEQSPEPFPPYPGFLISTGATGLEVRIIQTSLNIIRTVYQNIPLLVVDGVFGPSTRAAVIAFQQQFLLTPDGIVGPATWNKIGEMVSVVSGTVNTVS